MRNSTISKTCKGAQQWQSSG